MFQFEIRTAADYRDALVWNTPVAMHTPDENGYRHLVKKGIDEPFYVQAIEPGKSKRPESELFLSDFAKLTGDESANELLEFQQKHGIITSPMRLAYPDNAYGAHRMPQPCEFLKTAWGGTTIGKAELQGIEKSASIYQALVISSSNVTVVASLSEVRAAIKSINQITDLLIRENLNWDDSSFWGNLTRSETLRFATLYLAQAVDARFPLIKLSEEIAEHRERPLSCALMAQMAACLADREGIHVCENPDCPRPGGLFQYKGEGRRTGSKYLSLIHI